MSKKQALAITGSIIVSTASILLILREVPLSDVVRSIEQADRGQLLLALAFVTLSLFTRGIRWWGLLGKRMSLSRASHAVNVMFLGNQLPLRMGELARTLLASRDGVPLATAAASIVVERLVDTLIVVLMIATTVGHLPDVPDQVTLWASLFGVAAVVGFAVLILLAWHPKRAMKVVDRILHTLPVLRRLRLEAVVNHLLDGLAALADIRMLLFTLVWSAISWTTSLATFYFLHLALGIEVNYAHSVPLGVALASLSIAIPVSVAAVGPFEGAIIVSGQLVGMDSLAAISLGFLVHGASVLGYVIWGVIGLLALGISPGSAFGAKRNRGKDQNYERERNSCTND